ncbi:MAG: hypothetical protein U1E36_01825 [Rickettsiales bacterium]
MSLESHRIAAALDEGAFAQLAQRAGQAIQAGMDGLIERIAAPLNGLTQKLHDMEPGQNHIANLMGAAKDSLPSLSGGGNSEVAITPSKSPKAEGPVIEKSVTPGIEKGSPAIATAMADFRSCVSSNVDHSCSVHDLGAMNATHFRGTQAKEAGAGIGV